MRETNTPQWAITCPVHGCELIANEDETALVCPIAPVSCSRVELFEFDPSELEQPADTSVCSFAVLSHSWGDVQSKKANA